MVVVIHCTVYCLLCKGSRSLFTESILPYVTILRYVTVLPYVTILTEDINITRCCRVTSKD